jgi:hypothetical protein
MGWRVSSLFICCLVISGCSSDSDNSINTKNATKMISEVEEPLTNYKTIPYTFLSSDTIISPKGLIVKTIFFNDSVIKIEQALDYQMTDEELTNWKMGIQKSINDTTQWSYQFHFDFNQKNQVLASYISKVK